MATFKVRVACDIGGSKHNAMFLFRPLPSTLGEVVLEAERFYSQQQAGFRVAALHKFEPSTESWAEVQGVAELEDGCQLYAFRAAAADGQGSPQQRSAEVAQREDQRMWSADETDADREAAAFSRLDANGDGVVDEGEFSSAIKSLRLNLTASQLSDLFVLADEDGNGVVSRDEFSRFAVRFPAVVDAVHARAVDEDTQKRAEEALADAEQQLAAQRDVEQQLQRKLKDARDRYRDAEAALLQQREAAQTRLQRRPQMEQAQRDLVEKELALMIQRQRLRAEEEESRRHMLQLCARRAGEGLQTQPPPPTSAPTDGQRRVSANGSLAESQTSTSFFLPSECAGAADAGQPRAGNANTDSPKPPPLGLLSVGAVVEACNFTARPQFNGLRGTVVQLLADGGATVQFAVRGGVTLDLSAANICAAGGTPAGLPELGEAVEVAGSAGKVVGYSSGHALCEFADRAGVVAVPPDGFQSKGAAAAVRAEIAALRAELDASRRRNAAASSSPQRAATEAQRAALSRLARSVLT
eukprot:TRINITY_DN28109_c0_g1_i2.p1 TRINITY_DN28109_c0_g1~~TRINITY_DN28109_c0_g1_i2.p1  ORF type:complete len:547 (+),score=127.87 TRINITY_DN28109_c0_g1_i2:61-1641(+)